jgi:8-oxo-dGTP pyrophosphatase MutT (NUDIX family)
MNIKKFLGLQSKEDKIQEYKQLLEKSYKNSLRVDELAAEFSEQNSVLKSISTLSDEDRKEVEERNKKFISDHVKNISEAYKEKTSIEKSMIKLENDAEIVDILKDMKSLYDFKIMYKDKQISKSIYNDIIKAKTGKVRYADVLLFRGSKLLILQRAGDQGNHTDEWCIPGGHVDAGEDFRTAAQRELLEETGIDIPEDILFETAVATGKDFEIHYFIGHVSEETPAFVVVDSEEEIGSAWIEPGTELDDYEFIFDMKDNLKKILGLEQKPSNLIKIQKAYFNGDISEEVFKSYCEQHPDEIEKANNKTYFSHKERMDLAERGEAMPNGKYPIRNSQDLKDAIRLVGASDMPKSEVKAWIKKRAKELGLENELPESWNKKEDVEKGMGMNDVAPLKKEDLQDDTTGPQGDGIDDKKIEKAITFKKIEYEPKVVEPIEPNKYTYGEGQFSFSDSDGNHGDKLFDMLGMLQKVMTLNKKFSITIETEDNGEQTWNFDGTIRMHSLRKSENIEKSVNTENDTEGFKLLINFNDLDQAEVFKSIIDEMKESGKLDIESIIDDSVEIEKSWGINDIRKEVNNNPALDDGSQLAKAKDLMYGVFVDYANFLEGVKTRTKNIHWGELDNSKHVYLDDLIDELSDYEDKIMEAGQSGFGRFGDGEVNGEEIEENEPIELIDLIIERTKDFHEAIKDNIDYVGEMSWIEDFLATLKQTKYRLQLH